MFWHSKLSTDAPCFPNGKRLEGGGKETNMVHALNNTQRFCLIGKHERMAWLVRAFLEAETV